MGSGDSDYANDNSNHKNNNGDGGGNDGNKSTNAWHAGKIDAAFQRRRPI